MRIQKMFRFKKYFIVLIFASLAFPCFLQASDKKTLTFEEIKKEPELLRKFALAIIKRPQIIQELQEKMCKHNAELFNPWKEGKTWGELGSSTQNQLTKFVVKSQIQSILKRDKFYLMSNLIISNPMPTVEEVVLKGNPILVKIGLNQDRDSLNIYFDNPNAGEVYTRNQSQPAPATKLLIAFDITDIISKITTLGIDAWNPDKDGFLTTFCPAD